MEYVINYLRSEVMPLKYVNGRDVLPQELIAKIQDYTEGMYVYIPKRNTEKNKWGDNTNYRREMELRNQSIYDKYLEGAAIPKIADCYHLSLQSVRRIILSRKRKLVPVIIMIKELIKEWNMEGIPSQIYHSAWNINDQYVLKVYDDPSALERNITMMQTLNKVGIPVPQIKTLPNQKEYLEREGRFYLLTTRLKGKNIVSAQVCDDKWFYEFGTILAKLHIGFLECEKNISYWNNSMLEEMKGWVSRDLHKYNREYLKWEDVENAIHELTQVYEDLPKQLIHRDVHLGNFLFDDGTFSGYIDFDLSQRNIRIFDICYFSLGILLKEDNNYVEGHKWFGFISQVISGYSAISPLSDAEKKAITCVMKNIELLFTAYFLGKGDEKSAKDAYELFAFVQKNEKKIQQIIR